MNCAWVQRVLSAYCDGYVSEQDRQAVSLHLAVCRDCSFQLKQLSATREALRSLHRLSPPSELSSALRVLAFRAASQRRINYGFRALAGRWGLRFRLWADDIMRPVALPFAGGFLSAIVLFAVLVPPFLLRHNSTAADVPTSLFTEATLQQTGPFAVGEEYVADLHVDWHGRVVDYSFPSGQGWINNLEVRRNIENQLLFTVFNPGTMFGRPISGKVRVIFRRSQIDVRG